MRGGRCITGSVSGVIVSRHSLARVRGKTIAPPGYAAQAEKPAGAA